MGTPVNRIHHFALALLAFFYVFGCAADSRGEDLLAIYHQALAVSPALARSQALLDADRSTRPLARAGLLPKLNLAAGVSENHADISGFGPLEVDESYSGNFYSVTLTQPLFNGQAFIALDAAQAQTSAGEAALLVTGQQLILQVVEAYFGVLLARADVTVARDQLSLLQTVLDQAEVSREVGTGDIITVHETRARADAARAELISAENVLRIARQSLQRLTHAPFGQLDDLGPIHAEMPRPNRVEVWVQAALVQKPVLRQARQELQVARHQVEINSRSRWPRVDLYAGYRHAKGEFLPSMERDELSASVNLRFPLYQGGEIGARTELARSLAKANQYRLGDLRDQVRLDTETAFYNLESSVPRLNAAITALASTRTSLDATREGYRVGVRSIVDVLMMIQDLTAAQRDYHAALYDHVTARIRLKAATGVLAVEDLEAINTLLSTENVATDHPERTG